MSVKRTPPWQAIAVRFEHETYEELKLRARERKESIAVIVRELIAVGLKHVGR